MFPISKNQNYVSIRDEPTGTSWIDEFWKAIHFIARCYEPRDQNTKQAILNFYQNLANIVPSSILSMAMNKFILMTPDVIDVLRASSIGSSFFIVYPQILNVLNKSPQSFFSYCTNSEDLMFAWTFLLHIYWSNVSGSPEVPFSMLNAVCDKTTITKNVWANPMWYMIHMCARYAPTILNQTWAVSFKAFMHTLQYVLPCSVCREHIKENLLSFPMDQYLINRDSIFEYTWKLHNIVNKMLNKPEITLLEANYIYAPQSRPYNMQNSKQVIRHY